MTSKFKVGDLIGHSSWGCDRLGVILAVDITGQSPYNTPFYTVYWSHINRELKHFEGFLFHARSTQSIRSNALSEKL